MSNAKKYQYTVAELISALQALPQDLPVLVSGYETGFENPLPVAVMTVTHEPSRPYYDGEFQRSEEETGIKAIVLRRTVREVD